MENFSPAVSVVIPMFNAEKYLGVCLESILIQTFTDFEVIVVDDRSTDNSIAVAESFLERFGGRLKVISLEKNTGSGAVPRNVGLNFARGKYIYFIDADDLLLDITLETFYNFAEEYQTDVVYQDRFLECGDEIIPENLSERFICNPKFIVDEPTFESENISERVLKFLKHAFDFMPWSKFSRRDFLVNNEIKFPHITISEDTIWTFEVLFAAKKFLRVSTPLYIYRVGTNSIMRRERTPEQLINFRTTPLAQGVDFLDEFLRRQKFFQENPAVRLQVLNCFLLMQFDNLEPALKALEPEKSYEIFLREFSDAKISSPALVASLIVMMNLYRNMSTT